ncbi:MAG: CotH kinase family protein [Planctomycetes bacterium]|nr:CotH kinase family protein [Planctomycetota bacterium]
MNGFVSCLILFTGLVLGQDAKPVREPDASDDFFKKGAIPQLRIQVTESELEKLKADNRAYVRCTVVENRKTTYKNVGIKLKGAAGSFREWDDRPALTLNSNKFHKGQTFHGLDKFHLNNSVQDETFTHEWLCEELLREAGVPATRVTHARVWVNDRDLGLYVLKEGFDKTFLQRHFESSAGSLYDGGFVQDIDAELEKDSGKEDDRTDLIALLDACREPDLEQRWRRIEETLDVEAFITFMALELMTGHWDGYTQNKNNYRIYFNPADNRAHFLPHGMDQMFGDPNASILHEPGAIVSSTVMHNPAWRARYRERVRELLPLFDPPTRLNKRVDFLRRRLQPVLAAIDPQLSRDHAERVKEFKERLTARAASLKEQSVQEDPAPPTPPVFDENGNLFLPDDWFPAMESEDAVVEVVDLDGEQKGLSIQCGPSGHCVASWRRGVLLEKGTYILHARVKTKDVSKIEDERGSAAGLRISGSTRTNTVHGTTDWKPLEFEFTIEEDVREVVLVAELRTTSGQAWFDPESLHLSRKPMVEAPGK